MEQSEIKPILIIRLSTDYLASLQAGGRKLSFTEKREMVYMSAVQACPEYNVLVVPVSEQKSSIITGNAPVNKTGEISFEVLNANEVQLLDIEKLRAEINQHMKNG